MENIYFTRKQHTQRQASVPRTLARLNNRLMQGEIGPDEMRRKLNDDLTYCAWFGVIGAFLKAPVSVEQRFIVDAKAAIAHPETKLIIGDLALVEASFTARSFRKEQGTTTETTAVYEGPFVVACLHDQSTLEPLASVAVSYPTPETIHDNRLNRAVFTRAPHQVDVF